MCWSATASLAMVGVGAVATGLAASRGQPRAIWATMGYFTAMELLQASGYAVIDECGTTANRSITLLSYLHIVFQPFFINAFAMELVPAPVKRRIRRWVYALCAVSSATMLAQLLPLDWAGSCRIGDTLCGAELCLVSGEWHIAWDVPYNGLLTGGVLDGIQGLTGIRPDFPTYLLTVFALPLVYGAWRFVLMHALAGPLLAYALTSDPNEAPAVWCLFSIGILLLGLSPVVRGRFEVSRWFAWPKAWGV